MSRPRTLSKIVSNSLAAKLLVIALAAIVLIAGVASATVRFAGHAARGAQGINASAVAGLAASGEISLLVERHRRLIEAASVDPTVSIADTGQRSQDIETRILQLADGAEDPRLSSIFSELPAVIARARVVLAHVMAGAPDEARTAAAGYAELAVRLQDQLALDRDRRLGQATAVAGRLGADGRMLAGWAIGSAVVAVLLIGPLSFLVLRRNLGRLACVTETMRRLAENETRVSVPSIQDKDEIGEMARAVQVFKSNAIALHHHQAEIEKLNGWFDIALNNMARGLSMFDAGERLIVCNRRYGEMYALPESLTRPGTTFSDIIEHASRSAVSRDVTGEAPSSIASWLAEHRRTVASRSGFNQTHHMTDGRVFMINCQPLESGGWVDVHEEVTEKLRSAEKITELARFDALSGLANRHYFLGELEAAFASLRGGARPFAILWIDLDRFKDVNDTYGHPAGDALLSVVAERLRKSVRSTDFVARLGGDEFAIIMRGETAGAAAAAALAGRLVRVLGEPCEITGHVVSVGASIGIALAPESGADPGELMKNADIALYRAKSEGRGGHVFYCTEIEQSLKERRRLEMELGRAVGAGQLELHYQPILDLERRSVTRCEALMRWTHPELGAVSPGVFIPFAEEIGVIGELGEWAIRQACRTAAQWRDPVSVAVNLSAAQFATTDILEVVRAALSDSGLPARRLELEVTETLLLKDVPKIRETLHDLRMLGVSIALDDFGTGYSSLSYLRSFPFDKIKIDQTFVRDLPERAESVAIVRAIAGLARTLGMRTVAEGVETAAHLEMVTAAGCDEVQGYYFSRAVPADRIPGVIDSCWGLAAA